MTVKEYLQQPYILNALITAKQQRSDDIWAMATNTTSRLSHTGGCGAPNPDKIPNAIAKISQLEAELNEDIDNLYQWKEAVRHSISEVEDTSCRLLLVMRYVNFVDWGKIAERLGVTKNHAKYKLHNHAVNLIKTQYIV